MIPCLQATEVERHEQGVATARLDEAVRALRLPGCLKIAAAFAPDLIDRLQHAFVVARPCQDPADAR